MFQNVLGALAGKDGSKTKVKGKVVLMAKNMLDFTDAGASLINNVNELLGKQVHLQLISSVTNSPGKLGGIVGHPAYLSNWITTIVPLTPGDATYHITFDWDNDLGVPGAFLIKNNHDTQFFLKTVTLDDVPGHGRLHFVCNSWVYPAYRYKSDRIFFANQAYLPSETPAPLKLYRDSELVNLRGTGTGMLEEWDRVYDYDTYNDLGEPNARPILGGSSEYPYPRRGRTGRAPHKTDPEFESRLPLLLSLNIYVPRDERFNHIKFSDNLANGLKSIVQFLLPEFVALFDQTPGEFDSFQDVLNLYQQGIKLPTGPLLDQIRDNMPFELLRQFLQPDGQGLVAKFPVPQVIKDDKWAWRTDEEFAREMLAGVNPVCIQRLTEFPPTSGLDPKVYGNQNSSITKNHIETKLGGLTVDEAIMKNRLFMLDHHDTLIPYLRRINSTSTKMYATRTILFLQTDGTLKPLAIELSLPNPSGDGLGAINKIFTPCENGVEGTIWQLAKAFVAVNDYGVHQLISHWLNTHAIMEPFVIATNRQLSVLHPIHKLLQPHFRDTMNINATARQILVNEEGILEKVVFPGKYAMEMSAFVYKSWVFTDQALPADLIKRGMAVKDPNSPHGIKLLLEDYPYAVDGLKIWAAIEKWVKDYVEFYYKSDQIVQNDPEIQAWWKEVVEVGHGDLKSQPWWPKMQTKKELIDSVTIIIWIASALHAAVNFGQYPYAGYLPNRPSVSRRFMPELGTAEYAEVEANPEKAFFRTITPQLETLLGMSLIEILSRHASDEVYIGQRDTPEWTKDATPLAAFGAFEKKLGEIEKEIVAMNKDGKWKNRSGLVNVKYTLLHPTSEEGLTGKGVPNSISI